MQVGFIGLGNMGAPMATNLVTSGFAVRLFDLDRTRTEAVAALGGEVADDLGACVAGADVVCTSLPGPAEVRHVAPSLLEALSPGSIWVDLSTNDLACARELQVLGDAAGVELVDAPVTGGAEGAAAATLSVLCGGPSSAVDQVRPVLEAIGARIYHVGGHGAGYVAKIASVSLCYVQSVCLTEALLLGALGGVDAAQLLDIIQHSTGRSYVADRYGPEILDGGYDSTFDLGLADKDLRLALGVADTVGAALPNLLAVAELYRQSLGTHGFDAPHLIAMQTIEQANGLIFHQHHEVAHDPES